MTDGKIEKTWDKQGQAGIQQLFEAEAEAGKIVEQAKQKRIQLMKSAKEDADREALEFRKKLEAEYLQEVAKFDGTDSEYFTGLDEKKEELLEKMRKDAASHEQEVVSLLVEAATKF
ncbi:putative Vacuolar (H+)-ATPase G subunit [Monocercomonoides exilis]|uniref:putative Vacuolar (H+)-ATPase G subunit n=1 Tax=Monocercomonoides exilis TaxID=2049356 RepID=UPI003559CC2F|nr:putative Vacuolar (H+)-ATPase G subunit [Monocercomonoides exilis]|eukprot:MONOS_10973.1-p1 / transcript=MONOS_10973.1 / gene=MONOS_10973 / organism=Monocercomonoides_exilis_PA203 / gene_product=unspecified product / transcript_product=unspecified product / location=Mono_scaffold00523:37794-38388(-) / protein_length=116 / sequence_SO=supercontig / SO=protein_coding / is_pseudo=false